MLRLVPGFIRRLDFGDEPVAALRDRLDVARRVRIVANRSANILYGSRQRVVCDKRLLPYLLEQLLFLYYAIAMLYEVDQQIKRARRKRPRLIAFLYAEFLAIYYDVVEMIKKRISFCRGRHSLSV